MNETVKFNGESPEGIDGLEGDVAVVEEKEVGEGMESLKREIEEVYNRAIKEVSGETSSINDHIINNQITGLDPESVDFRLQYDYENESLIISKQIEILRNYLDFIDSNPVIKEQLRNNPFSKFPELNSLLQAEGSTIEKVLAKLVEIVAEGRDSLEAVN